MQQNNILIGAFEAPTVSVIKNAGYPGGRIAPDPGLKFLVVVVKLAEGCTRMLLREEGDQLFADGHTYPALGISSGQMMTQALDTFVGVRRAGMEIEGEVQDYLYAVLFAVPTQVDAAEVQLSGLPRTRLDWIDAAPTDLGTLGEGVKMRFLEDMSLPHALPFGHQDGQLASLVCHELPADECGILAQGAVDGVGVVFARVALGADVHSSIGIDPIVARLDDGSSVKCLGSIEWATFLEGEPNGPVSMLGIARKFDAIQVVGEASDIKLAQLPSYGGPTTQVRELEIKLALQFADDVVDRIKAIRVGNRWLGGPSFEGADEHITGPGGSSPSLSRESDSSSSAVSRVSPPGPDQGEVTTIVIAFLQDRVAHSVETAGETTLSRGVMRPSPASLVGRGIKLEMRDVQIEDADALGNCLLQQSMAMQDALDGHASFFDPEPQQVISGLIQAVIGAGVRAGAGAKVNMSSVSVSPSA